MNLSDFYYSINFVCMNFVPLIKFINNETNSLNHCNLMPNGDRLFTNKFNN
jgi:hypothetical protein